MSFRACILTVSTKGARGERVDESGEKISEALARVPAEIVGRAVVSDEVDDIQRQIREWLRATDPDLIVLTGGTGLGPRDVTPQAVEPLFDYLVPGIAEAMRAAGLRKTPHAMLSRSLAGVIGRTLVLALPGSPRGVVDSLEAVMEALPHGLRTLRGEVSDAPAAHRLRYDASEFPVVEVDSTFYAIPTEKTAELWVARTPKDFTFNAKAYA